MKKNVAIVATYNNKFSETFIQAHKNIEANVFFYYSGGTPTLLENEGPLFKKSIQNYLKKGVSIIKKENYNEYLFGKSLQDKKIDVVLAEFGINGVAVLPTCKRLNIPLVTYFFGYDAYKIDTLEKYISSYKKLFDYCKAIMVVSLDMKNQLISLGCPANKIVYSPCAPNEIFYDVIPSFEEPKSFIALGRFVNKKSPDSTILAFKKVVDKHPDAKLYFGGDGVLLEVSKRLVQYFKLEKNVIFIGIQDQKSYIEYFKRIAGFVQHSIIAEDGDKEGTPVAVLEASLAGLPVISTLHAGIPEVVINTETGLLVPEHDIDAMADAIISIIENPSKAKIMGEKGKSFVKDNFSMTKHLKAVEQTLFN